MISIIELKTQIYDLLKVLGSTYEISRVPQDAAFPYIVYSLETSNEGFTDNTEQVIFTLSVTLLDHDRDRNTTVIETLISSVVAALHKKHVSGTGWYFQILRVNVLSTLPVTDEYTMRREINFTVNTYSEET